SFVPSGDHATSAEPRPGTISPGAPGSVSFLRPPPFASTAYRPGLPSRKLENTITPDPTGTGPVAPAPPPARPTATRATVIITKTSAARIGVTKLRLCC